MTRKPLSLEETARELAALRSKPTSDVISEAMRGIEKGKADERAARMLLAVFCRRAKEVRDCMSEHSDTPDLIEFVAARFALFLAGRVPDLMKAFGLKRATRGRKPQRKTRQRAEVIAAKVLEQMNGGKTLDEAAETVAAAEGVNDSTARNFYSRNKQAAANLLLYRYFLDPDFGRVNSDK